MVQVHVPHVWCTTQALPHLSVVGRNDVCVFALASTFLFISKDSYVESLLRDGTFERILKSGKSEIGHIGWASVLGRSGKEKNDSIGYCARHVLST